MASLLKEEEKNERIIRSLLKLPENRRCINCNSLGPQYVCTNFWTFVCINCSGIHREFTHRVKSVSMAKFTSQEVTALQEGGNKRAKEIYLKEWDAQRQSLPDSSNVLRLRDFIKHVYVDKRYSGDKNYDKPPRAKTGDKDDSYENRRMDSFQGSRSPPYDDAYERRSDRSSPGGTSPGFDQESRQYGDYRKSPSRPEVVNDWRREDRFGNGRKFEDSRMPDGDSKLEGRSPDQVKGVETSSPPIVRPVREILGDNVVPLRISEPPKANGGRASDGSVQPQRTASSSSLGSSNGNPAEVKHETLRSLIDFDADPEPPRPVASPPTTTAQPVAQTVSSTSDNNWASFDSIPEAKPSQVPPPSTNTLESVLSQLSVPASVPGHDSRVTSGVSPFGHGQQFPSFPPGSSVVSSQPIAANQQSSLFPVAGNQTTLQQFTRPIDGAQSSQPRNFSFAPNSLGPLSTQAVSEVNSSERRALPADLFTQTYSPYPGMAPGWQTGPPRGLVYPMQYHTAMPMQQQPMPMYMQPSKSTNPFDFNNEPPQTAVQFPSMGSLQGALPNVQPSSGLMRTSSLGTPPAAWMPNQSAPYPSAMPPQANPYGASMPPRPYMGQQIPSSASFSVLPGVGNFGSDLSTFGSMNTDQQMPGRFSAPSTPQHFPSVGGNPFG